jgi:glutamyl/glutaminyl-tRNA synthetase
MCRVIKKYILAYILLGIKDDFNDISWNIKNIKLSINNICKKLGIELKIISRIIRLALTGQENGLGIYDICYIIEKENVIKRFEYTIIDLLREINE